MSTIKSSAEDLTLNADGSGNDIILQSNGSNIATVDQAGLLTATTFAGSGDSLIALNATNLGAGTVPTARLGSGTASSSTVLYGDQTYKADPTGGKILQVVNMTTSTSTGVSDATWTATSVTLAITPSATSSKILLMWSGQMYIQNTAGDGGYAHHFSQAISGGATTAPVELHSNSAVNYSSHYTQQTSGQFSHYVTTHGLVSPSTTSAITYTLYIINYNANGVGVNSQGGKSNLTLMEIDGS